MNNTITIESGDIIDFTFKIQQAILDGYRLVDNSDYAPICIGFMYVTTMIKLIELPEMFDQFDKEAISPQELADLQSDFVAAAELVSEVDKSVGEMLNSGSMAVEPNTIEPTSTTPKQVRQTRGRK